MAAKPKTPRWWQLDALFGLYVLLLVFQVRLPISAAGHEVAEVGSLFLIVGLSSRWLHINADGLRQGDTLPLPRPGVYRSDLQARDGQTANRRSKPVSNEPAIERSFVKGGPSQ